jgi:chromosome segregation ATPase
MEALRTRLDKMQWEINRLNAENLKLGGEDPTTSELVDREAQLEETTREVAELTDRTRELERQLDERAREAAQAGERAEQAETRAAGLDTERNGETQKVAILKAESAELQTTVREREEDLARARQELEELDTKLGERERRSRAAGEALLQTAELQLYRTVEGERQKCEAREARQAQLLLEHNGQLRVISSTPHRAW